MCGDMVQWTHDGEEHSVGGAPKIRNTFKTQEHPKPKSIVETCRKPVPSLPAVLMVSEPQCSA